MTKKLKDSTNPRKEKARWIDQYQDIITLTDVPINILILERIQKELLDWAFNNDDALKITQFFRSKGIPFSTAHRWCQLHPDFKQTYEEAMRALGDRREIGALKKKYEPTTIMRMMPLYDKSWRKVEEWRASIKQKEQEKQNNTTVQVVIEPIPDSPLVPQKKE